MKKIILASKSGRRSRILTECGILHSVVPSGADETISDHKHISEIVQINALAKAEAVAEGNENSIVIGADTLVIHGNDIWGKPKDEEEALGMLERFFTGEVEVYTGLCVIDPGEIKKAVGFEKSSLTVRALKGDALDKYFRLLAPYDKAGGFSIEGVGSLLFDNIKGSYFNILGLPMMKLSILFEEIDLDILDFIV